MSKSGILNIFCSFLDSVSYFFLLHCFYLVVDEQLHGVAAPLDEHQLIGLSRYGVGEGSAEARTRSCLQPQADRQGKELVDHRPLHPGVHVVGPHGEVEQESGGALQLLVVSW